MTQLQSTCNLCKETKVLKSSHLIPKFVGEWIKETSVTKKMRSAQSINKRIQDIKRVKLLCEECEQSFSIVEKYFSETLFKPFLNKDTPIINYDKNLSRFILSLLWRMLVNLAPQIQWKNSSHELQAESAMEDWRSALNDKKNFENYNLYLLMLKLVPDARNIEGTNVDINWYFFRAVDGTVAQTDDDAIVYVKIPGFAFFGSIYNSSLDYFRGCKVHASGTFDFEEQDAKPLILRFLHERSLIALSPNRGISEVQRQKISADYEKYKERIDSSFAMSLYTAKEVRKKK